MCQNKLFSLSLSLSLYAIEINGEFKTKVLICMQCYTKYILSNLMTKNVK